MTDPTLRAYPLLGLIATGNPHPRPQHKAWDGLTLAATDSFWSTNHPPNGFQLRLHRSSRSARGLRRQGKEGRTPPTARYPAAPGRASGKTALMPAGVDPALPHNWAKRGKGP